MSSNRPPAHVTAPRRVLLVLAVLCGVAAVTVPGWAGSTARAVLIVAAVAIAGSGVLTLVRSIPFATTSRFQPIRHERERRDVPPELETLIRSVQDSTASDGRKILTPTVLLHLRRVATARLAGMRLDVEDPADHQAIQQHVSLAMWGVVAPGPATGRAQHLPSLEIPADALPALLDELERL